ncbi:hypothetical protein G8C93_11370 [Cellulosimicrobium cellulans]|uniref:DUF6270 domain-containing protein n=1 Tax=Cellulosimicrobium cellulans TaxID=1710 RepID=UPI0018832809|nr:DUF6270 domain-containing protein [Cellulosimicrobium cellulans]MBE9926485.1 hypothetical protein [Cellulosimicrobium cellulans]
MKQNAVRVTIVGSCVTRDAFDLSSDQRWELGAYYARSGLASAMSDLEYAGVDLTGIESAFQRRMVEQDLGKSLASHLAQDTSDLVVYDPIDERFDLAVHPVSGAVCTLSAELSRAAHVPVSRTILSGSEEFYVLWERGWVRLLAALDARGRRAHLRVNAAKWATALDDGSEFPAMYAPDRIRRANEFLDRLYSRMSEDLSADQLVSFSAKDAGVAASDHKWGRSPFHYQDAFYDHLRSALVRSLGSSSSSDPDVLATFHARSGDDRRFVFDVRPEHATGDVLIAEFRLSGWADVAYVGLGCMIEGAYCRILLAPVEQGTWIRVAVPRAVLKAPDAAIDSTGDVDAVRFYVSGRAAGSTAVLEVRTADLAEYQAERTASRSAETLWIQDWHSRYQLPIAETSSVAAFNPIPGLVALYPVVADSLTLWAAAGIRTSERLTVGFHGAADRGTTEYPYFERMASRKDSPWSFVLFSDPTLTMDPELTLGWFLGTAERDLVDVIQQVVEKVAAVSGARSTAITGGSGGGFAALQLAARMPRSIAVVFAPQTVLSRYETQDWASAARVVFGSTDVESDPTVLRRVSAVERYRAGTENLVDYVINRHDHHHVAEHCAPFAAVFGLSPEGGESADRRVRIVPVDLGPGHVPASREQFESALASAFARAEAYLARS